MEATVTFAVRIRCQLRLQAALHGINFDFEAYIHPRIRAHDGIGLGWIENPTRSVWSERFRSTGVQIQGHVLAQFRTADVSENFWTDKVKRYSGVEGKDYIAVTEGSASRSDASDATCGRNKPYLSGSAVKNDKIIFRERSVLRPTPDSAGFV